MISNVFNIPRKENEINLYEEICKDLDVNSPSWDREFFDACLDKISKGCGDFRSMNAKGQRFIINKFFSRQLSGLEFIENVTVTEARLCLIESGEVEDWLRLWNKSILPVLVTYKLPRNLV